MATKNTRDENTRPHTVTPHIPQSTPVPEFTRDEDSLTSASAEADTPPSLAAIDDRSPEIWYLASAGDASPEPEPVGQPEKEARPAPRYVTDASSKPIAYYGASPFPRSLISPTEQDARCPPEQRALLRRREREKYFCVWRTDAIFGEDEESVQDSVWYDPAAMMDENDGEDVRVQFEYIDGRSPELDRWAEIDRRIATARHILDLRVNFRPPQRAGLLSLTASTQTSRCRSLRGRGCEEGHRMCPKGRRFFTGPIIRRLCDEYLEHAEILALSQTCGRLYWVIDVRKVEYRAAPGS